MSALFLKILNLSINASWLILAVIAARLLLKKAPKWIICLLWGLVAIRLLCPFSLESVLSLVPSREVVPENIEIVQNPHIESGVRIIDNTVNPVIEKSFSPEITSSVNPMQVVVYVASVIWLVGMTIMLLYALISFILLKRKVRASIMISDRVQECDEVRSPFILGIIRPVIYVPSGMDERTLELVTAHEEAHLKRHDHWWKPMGFMLLSVYWFNPLCWIAYILLCRDIEAACDEKVIQDKDKDYVASYSQALLDLSYQRRVIAICPLAFGETGVKGRIRDVLNYKKPAFWVIIAAIIACIVIAVCFLTDPEKKASNDTADVASVVNETELKDNGDSNTYHEEHVEEVDNRVYLGDIDQNGVEEYIDYHSNDDADTYIYTWELYFNDEVIYHGTNVIPCDFGEVWYINLDDDAEKEIFVKIYPHVNSMPQTQYVALKRTGTEWKELENTDVGYESDSYTNAFPIQVCKGKGKNQIEISCDGCENYVEFDVTEHYTQLLNQDEDLILKNLANSILNTDQYKDPGITMGEPAAWGVWELARGSFDGKDCIVATHGIQGLGGKFDIIGTADVYFRYDAMGKIKVLDLEFKAENGNNDVISDSPLGLTMSAVNVSSTGCTLVFEQSGGNVTGELQTGVAFDIQVKDADEKWVNVSAPNPMSWDDIAYLISNDDTTELDLDWEHVYGYLADGHYRIVKKVMDYRSPGDYDEYDVYAEFDIGNGIASAESVTDWMDITLPSGYSISSFRDDIGWQGGALILPRSYDIVAEFDSAPSEWIYSGLISRMPADNTGVTYKNGIPDLSGIPMNNHTYAEYIKVIGLERSNMQWPAIMLKESHDLYTASDMSRLSASGIDTEAMDLTSDYWSFWFVKEGEDTYYLLTLSAKEFTQEEAEEIARTVSIK